MQYFLWINFCFGISVLSLNAQTSKSNADVPPPQAPFVATVPESAQWTLVLKRGKEALNAVNSTPVADKTPVSPTDIQQIRSTKTGKVKHDVITFGNGSSAEVWYYEKFVLFLSNFGNKVLILPEEVGMDKLGERGDPIRSSGFPGVSWVKESRYDAPVKFQGELCYHYILKAAAQAAPSPDPTFPGIGAAAEAWISVKTNFPVAYRFDDTLYSYTFDSARPTNLTLPANYQEEIDRYLHINGR